jgi:hypothetical protein
MAFYVRKDVINSKKRMGGRCHAPAVSVINAAECARRYGGQFRTKYLDGEVCGLVPKISKSNRTTNYVYGKWYLDSNKTQFKMKAVYIGSVKEGWVSTSEATGEGAASSGATEAACGTSSTTTTTTAARSTITKHHSSSTSFSTSAAPPGSTTTVVNQLLHELESESKTEGQETEDAAINEYLGITTGACCMGVNCKDPTLELRKEHVCPNCNKIIHAICGKFDDETDKYICEPKCIAQLPSILELPTKLLTQEGQQEQLPQQKQSEHQTSTVPFITVNGCNWYELPQSLKDHKFNPVRIRQWKFKLQHNGNRSRDYVSDDSEYMVRHMSRYDFFLLVFPKEQLELTVRLTNKALRKLNLQTRYTYQLTVGELLKFIGILILGTRYESGSRRELWSTNSWCKYIDPPKFGDKTGMVRDRFDVIFSNICFSHQPDTRPDGMSDESYRWMLIDDFVSNFNSHREKYYKPSHIICVDESISRWYGLGGSWINSGLPMYVAQDRKPENGCEIQNAADGVSGIMMQLKLVKGGEES